MCFSIGGSVPAVTGVFIIIGVSVPAVTGVFIIINCLFIILYCYVLFGVDIFVFVCFCILFGLVFV